tara:strand:- start:131 stop:262 length:132 start_codon:yes stop_codon:yes gene_type:complete
MSNIGIKSEDQRISKMIANLEREIGQLKTKVFSLEKKVKALGG